MLWCGAGACALTCMCAAPFCLFAFLFMRAEGCVVVAVSLRAQRSCQLDRHEAPLHVLAGFWACAD